MTTQRSLTNRSATERGPFEGSRHGGNREVRSVSASEVLAILEPKADEPESIRTMYLWKTGQPAPSVQASAA